MNTPAVMQGVYVDCKFMPGLKSARIAIDIPIEHSNEFLRMFGAPDRANPVAVAIARMDVAALNAPSVPEKSVEPAKVVKAETPKVAFKDRPRSQQAALRCQADDFQKWLGVDMDYGNITREMDANAILRERLGIESKKELDASASKAIAWDAMLCDFDVRNQVRA